MKQYRRGLIILRRNDIWCFKVGQVYKKSFMKTTPIYNQLCKNCTHECELNPNNPEKKGSDK